MSAASDLVLLARVIGSLVVVVVAALITARLARRAGLRAATEDLRVVQRVGLTREAGAVVLDVGGHRLLLGVTGQRVNLLADLGPLSAATEGTALITPADVDPHATVDGPDADPLGTGDGPDADPRAVAAAGAIAAVPRQPGPQQRSGPAPAGVSPTTPTMTRRAIREAAATTKRRRPALPPTQRGSGSVLDPRTWQQGLEALRDRTARRR